MQTVDVLKGPALVYYLIKTIIKEQPDKQIGKTIIQKMMYLLEKKQGRDFGYTMYHYGPYSSQITEYLNLIESLDAINVEWRSEKGYFITPKENTTLEKILSEKEKKDIEEIVRKFKQFSATELSIIATALYVKENFGVEKSTELIETVLSLKPKNDKGWIKKVLSKGGIINETNRSIKTIRKKA